MLREALTSLVDDGCAGEVPVPSAPEDHMNGSEKIIAAVPDVASFHITNEQKCVTA